MDIQDKLVRTTVQLRSSQHKALENLSGPGKSISHLVRTAVDTYLEPIYEQAHEDQKMDKFLNELEQAENKMEQLNEKAISIEDIFDDLKSKV
jgi:Arc/MetJ-type ribon-helix-helix transcriptional regulator